MDFLNDLFKAAVDTGKRMFNKNGQAQGGMPGSANETMSSVGTPVINTNNQNIGGMVNDTLTEQGVQMSENPNIPVMPPMEDTAGTSPVKSQPQMQQTNPFQVNPQQNMQQMQQQQAMNFNNVDGGGSQFNNGNNMNQMYNQNENVNAFNQNMMSSVPIMTNPQYNNGNVDMNNPFGQNGNMQSAQVTSGNQFMNPPMDNAVSNMADPFEQKPLQFGQMSTENQFIATQNQSNIQPQMQQTKPIFFDQSNGTVNNQSGMFNMGGEPSNQPSFITDSSQQGIQQMTNGVNNFFQAPVRDIPNPSENMQTFGNSNFIQNENAFSQGMTQQMNTLDLSNQMYNNNNPSYIGMGSTNGMPQGFDNTTQNNFTNTGIFNQPFNNNMNAPTGTFVNNPPTDVYNDNGNTTNGSF